MTAAERAGGLAAAARTRRERLLALAGAVTYAGSTLITGGTLQLGGDNEVTVAAKRRATATPPFMSHAPRP